MGLFSRSKKGQDSPDEIAQIRDRIAALKSQDLRTKTIKLGDREVLGYVCSIHGAEKHRYEYAAPLDAASLATFEAKLGSALPAEYRAWLTQAGNGGVGPMYGLLPLETEPSDTPQISYASDFPLTAPGTAAAVAEGDDAAWQAQTHRLHHGMTYLADEGDGAYNILILRGPSAGQLWWYSYESAVAKPILNPTSGSPITFFEWYQLWLDRAAASVQGQNGQGQSGPARNGPAQIASFAEFI